MKKSYMFLFLIVIVNSMLAQTAVQPAGSGTEPDPYLIGSLENLYWVTQNTSSWDKYLKQTADIDASSSTGWASGAGFSPIGNSGTKFNGTYDGNGHSISDIFINSTAQNVGFVGYLGSGTIQYLGLINLSVTSTDQRIGGLVGTNDGTINYCYTTGTVNGSFNVGGLVGLNNGGTINNSFSRCSVNSSLQTQYGGFVGLNWSGQPITKCYSTGAIGGSGGGGFIGSNSGSVSDCYWDTETSGRGSSAAGTGKNTAEMKTQSTFTNWDFIIVWIIDGTNNDGYPYLQEVTLLPVELISFSAQLSYNFILLNWQTATEVNNYGFEIQRSVISGQRSVNAADDNWTLNAERWTNIGFVEGNGNSNSPKAYSFTDNNLNLNLDLKLGYRLKQIDTDGNYEYSNEIEVDINSLPNQFSLEQNYPNPFNPSTVICYQLSAFGNVKLTVYDVLGNEVAILVNEEKEPGFYEVDWNANGLSSGVYYYRLTASGGADSFTQTKKLMLVK